MEHDLERDAVVGGRTFEAGEGAPSVLSTVDSDGCSRFWKVLPGAAVVFLNRSSSLERIIEISARSRKA